MPTETALIMDELWRRHGDDGAWVFSAHPSKYGDFFLSMSVFHNFRFRLGQEHDLRLLVHTPGHYAIARMFEHLFTSVRYEPDLAQAHVPSMQEWTISRGRAKFAPGGFIWVYPLIFCFPQYQINGLTHQGRVSYPELCLLGYRLAFELAAMPPQVTETMREEAEGLARQHSIEPDRSLVMFPYASSYPQDSLAHFEAFAHMAKRAGYYVVTSISGNERPVPDTPGIAIPFDLLIPFCELAGSVVALRSGIVDILASAQCRKIWIYARQSFIDVGSVVDYELGGDAAEIAFDFRHGTVEEFLEIFPRFHTPLYADVYNSVPLPVQRYLEAHCRDTGAVMSLADPGYVHTFGKYRGVGGIVLGNGWSGLEGWGAWTVGARAFLYIGNIYADRPRLSDDDGSPNLMLHLTLAAALNECHAEQQIRVRLGDVKRSYVFIDGPPAPVELPIPLPMARERYLKVVIDILTPHPPDIRPTDPRPLGVGLSRIAISTIIVGPDSASGEARANPPLDGVEVHRIRDRSRSCR